jgi:hypothetical protein
MKKLKNGYLCLMALFTITAFAGGYDEYGGGNMGGYSPNNTGFNSGYSGYQSPYATNPGYGYNTGGGTNSGGVPYQTGNNTNGYVIGEITVYAKSKPYVYVPLPQYYNYVAPSYNASLGQMFPNYYGGGGNNNTTTAFDKINYPNLDPCTTAIVEKLKKLKEGGFSKVISKLDGVLKGSIPVDINGSDNVNISNNAETTWGESDFNHLYIDISNNYLNNATQLSIATTVMHEMVHAYLKTFIAENLFNGSEYLKNFSETWDAWSNFKNKPEAQHEDMTKIFLTTLAKGLQEYDTGIPVTNGEPKQLYKDLSWSGLYETKDFKKLDAKERDRILSVILAEEVNQTQYSDGQTMKPQSTPCKK